MTSSLSREGMDAAAKAFREANGKPPYPPALESAITAYLSATGWRTIDSAPKDGSKVLVWSTRHVWKEPAVAYWGRAKPLEYAVWLGGHCNIQHIDQPTHWMPLPAPPESRP